MIQLKDINIICQKNKLEFSEKIYDHVHVTDNKNNSILHNGFYFRKLVKIEPIKEIVATCSIEKLYFAYSNSWISNYQHLLCDFYPYLYYYKINNIDAYIGIPEFVKSKPCKQLLDILQIDKSKIIWLRDSIMYNISNFYTYKYSCTLKINELEWSIEPLKYLNKIINNNTEIPKEKLFISRDDVVTNSNNNNFAGKARDIFNKEQIYKYCSLNNIKIESMSQYSIIEKNKILAKYNTIITLYGANIINLVFCKDITNIIILGNALNKSPVNYYKKLLETIFSHSINVTFIDDPKAVKYFNQPYIINLNRLHHTLLNIDSTLKLLESNRSITMFDEYKSNDDFLLNLLFRKLLQREPSNNEKVYHLKNIDKNGREAVFYEFTGCYEYHTKNTSPYMLELLKNKGKL